MCPIYHLHVVFHGRVIPFLFNVPVWFKDMCCLYTTILFPSLV